MILFQMGNQVCMKKVNWKAWLHFLSGTGWWRVGWGNWMSAQSSSRTQQSHWLDPCPATTLQEWWTWTSDHTLKKTLFILTAFITSGLFKVYKIWIYLTVSNPRLWNSIKWVGKCTGKLFPREGNRGMSILLKCPNQLPIRVHVYWIFIGSILL